MFKMYCDIFHEVMSQKVQMNKEAYCWVLGVQTGVMMLAGRPVAMAAQEDQLAVAVACGDACS